MALRSLLGEACEEIGSSRHGSRAPNASSRLSARTFPPSAIYDRSPASACSPRPPCRLRRRSSTFPNGAPLRQLPRLDATRALERQRSGGSGASRSGATPTCARCSPMARAPSCAPPTSPALRRACTPGRSPLQQRRGHNVAAIALANKLARIVWAVWRQERCFEPHPKLTDRQRALPTDGCRENDRRDGTTGPTGAGTSR